MAERPAKSGLGRQGDRAPGRARHRGRVRDRHLEAARPDRAHHARLRLHEHRRDASRRSRTSTATRASSATAATTSSRSPSRSTRRSSRPRGCSSTASCRPRTSATTSATQIRQHTLLHEDVKRFYDGFPKDAHPMAMLASVVNALATFYQSSEDPHDPEHVQLSIIRLLAKLPTIAAYSYKKSIGQPFLYPDNSLDLIENFLRMMFAVPSEPYEVSPTVVHALKQLLILHADHEQNCSTSTVRLVGSRRREHLRVDRGGHRRAVGSAARRREPGRDRDARADPRRAAATSSRRRAGQGPERRLPPLGLRPPRVQELRPAGRASSR